MNFVILIELRRLFNPMLVLISESANGASSRVPSLRRKRLKQEVLEPVEKDSSSSHKVTLLPLLNRVFENFLNTMIDVESLELYSQFFDPFWHVIRRKLML